MAGTSRAEQPGIVGVLNREWAELVSNHQPATARWAARHDALAGCRSLDDLVAAASIDADPVLTALLAEVATGDRLAGRVVVQLLIGRMVAMSGRDHRATVDDYLSALCCRIFSYDLVARPCSIAANLSMDALQLVSAERRWTRYREVVPWPIESFREDHLGPQPVDDDGPGGAQVLAAANRLGLIDRGAAELLDQIYVRAVSTDTIARRHRVTPSTVRVRCHRAVSTLASHADELLEAC